MDYTDFDYPFAQEIQHRLEQILRFDRSELLGRYNLESWKQAKQAPVHIFLPEIDIADLVKNSLNTTSTAVVEAVKKRLDPSMLANRLKHELSLVEQRLELRAVVVRPFFVANDDKELVALFEPRRKALILYLTQYPNITSNEILRQQEIAHLQSEQKDSLLEPGPVATLPLSETPLLIWILDSISGLTFSDRLHSFVIQSQNDSNFPPPNQELDKTILWQISDYCAERGY